MTPDASTAAELFQYTYERQAAADEDATAVEAFIIPASFDEDNDDEDVSSISDAIAYAQSVSMEGKRLLASQARAMVAASTAEADISAVVASVAAGEVQIKSGFGPDKVQLRKDDTSRLRTAACQEHL